MDLQKLQNFTIDTNQVSLETNIEEIKREDYEITKVESDGNCMFTAALKGYSAFKIMFGW